MISLPFVTVASYPSIRPTSPVELNSTSRRRRFFFMAAAKLRAQSPIYSRIGTRVKENRCAARILLCAGELGSRGKESMVMYFNS